MSPDDALRREAEYLSAMPADNKLRADVIFLVLRDRAEERDRYKAELESWRTWAQFVYANGGPVAHSDKELQRMIYERLDARYKEIECQR
jgi:hypothetical protein